MEKPGEQPRKKNGRNPYHLLTVNNYSFFSILAIVPLCKSEPAKNPKISHEFNPGLSALMSLAGVICPYWSKTLTGNISFGPFFCYQSNLTQCKSILTFTKASNTVYTAAGAMSAVTTAFSFLALGAVVFLFVRMRRERLFDSLQRLVTFGALGAAVIAMIAGFATVALMYYKIVNDEGITFSASDGPCGIVFAMGVILLCLAIAFIIMLLLYRQTSEEPQAPPPPKPGEQPKVLHAAPPTQIFRQEGQVPENPYGNYFRIIL